MIIPAVLETDFEEIKKKVEILQSQTPLIQIDVCDGKFTENKTFTNLKKLSELEMPFDVHLMVENPLEFLDKKIANIASIGIHIESKVKVSEFIQEATKLGYETGICLNPETEVNAILPYLEATKYVQFLSVTPGAQGQNFRPEVLDKIEELKLKYPFVTIQIDGGINESNIQKILGAKVDNIVIGSEIVKSENPVENYIKFRDIERNYKNE